MTPAGHKIGKRQAPALGLFMRRERSIPWDKKLPRRSTPRSSRASAVSCRQCNSPDQTRHSGPPRPGGLGRGYSLAVGQAFQPDRSAFEITSSSELRQARKPNLRSDGRQRSDRGFGVLSRDRSLPAVTWEDVRGQLSVVSCKLGTPQGLHNGQRATDNGRRPQSSYTAASSFLRRRP